MIYQNIVLKIKIYKYHNFSFNFFLFNYIEDTHMDRIINFIDQHIKNTYKDGFNFSAMIYDDFKNINMLNPINFKCINLDSIDSSISNDCRYRINNLTTEFIISTFFSDDKTIYEFQYLINNLFNSMTKNIINYLNVHNGKFMDTDILFLYKGGTTLKILYDTYKSYFTETENKYFYSIFSDSFSRSDSDYVVMINPNITEKTHGFTFDFVYKLVNYTVTRR